MADEEDPWAFDEGDAEADSAPPAAGGAAAAVGDDTAAASAAGGAEGAPGEEAGPDTRPPAEDDGYRKPVQLYRHWVRPKFLEYRYMSNYRTNYYDDVIDFLDKRQSGVKREIPRAQTWAERVLRTNSRTYEEETVAEHDRFSVKALTLDSAKLPFTYQRSATQKYLSRSKSMLTMRRSVIFGTNP